MASKATITQLQNVLLATRNFKLQPLTRAQRINFYRAARNPYAVRYSATGNPTGLPVGLTFVGFVQGYTVLRNPNKRGYTIVRVYSTGYAATPFYSATRKGIPAAIAYKLAYGAAMRSTNHSAWQIGYKYPAPLQAQVQRAARTAARMQLLALQAQIAAGIPVVA